MEGHVLSVTRLYEVFTFLFKTKNKTNKHKNSNKTTTYKNTFTILQSCKISVLCFIVGQIEFCYDAVLYNHCKNKQKH